MGHINAKNAGLAPYVRESVHYLRRAAVEAAADGGIEGIDAERAVSDC
jgi:hypothetical protein